MDATNRPQQDYLDRSSSVSGQQQNVYPAPGQNKQHQSSSAAFNSVSRPINIIGDVLSRGRDEMKEGIKSLSQLQQTQALRQQGGAQVQNIKNLGTKLQKGDTKVQEGLRTLGSKLQQNIVGVTPSTEQQQASKKVVQGGLRSIGTKLQQINISSAVSGAGIGSGGGLADDLQSLQAKIQEDKEFHTIKREAEEACLNEMRVHLVEFLKTYPENHYGFHPRYDEWIENLHPENAYEGRLIAGLDKEIDLRFFLEDSDHRKLWNQYAIPERHVKARNQQKQAGNTPSSKIPYSDDPTIAASMSSTNGNNGPEIVDLLSGLETTTTSAILPSTTSTDPVDHFDNLFGGNPAVIDSTASAPIMHDLLGGGISATATEAATSTSNPAPSSGDNLDQLFGSDSVKEKSGPTPATKIDPHNPPMANASSGGNSNKAADGDLINFF